MCWGSNIWTLKGLEWVVGNVEFGLYKLNYSGQNITIIFEILNGMLLGDSLKSGANKRCPHSNEKGERINGCCMATPNVQDNNGTFLNKNKKLKIIKIN